MPIKPDDFERPIVFDFGSDAIPIGKNTEVTDKHPSNLSASVNWNTEIFDEANFLGRYSLEVNPLLLNKGDWFVIKLLLTGSSSQIKADARIAGINWVTERRLDIERGQPNLVMLTLAVVGFVGIVTACNLFVGLLGILADPLWRALLIGINIVIAFGVLYTLVRLIWIGRPSSRS
ncbi:MAG: hypothetical protein L0287_36395 [Anaerolineae bacterium]|nr:hypothetical protein [Anaerolineae bacterium]